MNNKTNNSSAAKCKICGDAPTIKSHLIPEAFVKEIFYHPKNDEKHMLVFNETGYKARSTTGRYESDLLCGKCDGKLGVFEESALVLLRDIRQIKIGRKSGTDSVIKNGVYSFRVAKADELIRFACGILWKYMSVPDSNPGKITVDDFRLPFEQVCFHDAPIPMEIDVFLERDVLSATAFDDPHGVFYYVTPSVNMRGGKRTAWFSVGGFIVYVKLDDGPSDFAPSKCWIKGRRKCFFNVDIRALQTNFGIVDSMTTAKDDLRRLNRSIVPPARLTY